MKSTLIAIAITTLTMAGYSQSDSKIEAMDQNFPEEWALVRIDNKYGFIDHEGNEIVAPMYQKIWSFDETRNGWALVQKDGFYGYINKKGEEVVSTQYDEIYPFGDYFEDWALVKRDGKFGFINSKGEEVIEPKYDEIKTVQRVEGIVGTRKEQITK